MRYKKREDFDKKKSKRDKDKAQRKPGSNGGGNELREKERIGNIIKKSVKKASVKKNQAVVSNLPTEQIAEPKNKVNKVKKVKSNDEKVVQKEDEVVEEEEGDSKTRSFKVKLPSDEGFSGRFTGLTPYQAANKALSKYFRCAENNEGDVNITFSIKESTRGSKRHEYNYKGSRLKLEKPITYTIKSLSGEERVITKQYKNQLIKIKKNVVKQAAAVV
jgi:hypothetical protein